MKKIGLLSILVSFTILYSCDSQNEVLLKDCNAFGGVIRYKDELFTGKVKDIRNGKLRAEWTVEDGRHVGDKTSYFSDGKTISKIDKWKNGNIVETIYFDENGKETGRD